MMDSPKVTLTRRWPEAVENDLVKRYGAALRHGDKPMSIGELALAARTHEVICCTIGDPITAEVVEQPGAALRLLCNFGAGVDHIDLDACWRNGIAVTNTPDVLTDATAEIALMLMLMVARRAEEGSAEMRLNAWTGWRPTHLLGTQLTGKALGLVGFGRIAQATAALARAFGMNIHYFARNPANNVPDARFEPSLGQLLRSCDVISLHVPGGEATRNLINAEAFSLMKPNAILINTARGSVVDEDALIDALQSRRIAGAGLDVFMDEPRVRPDLLECPTLVALPHLGSATIETRTAMGSRAVRNLDSWVSGMTPPDLIDVMAAASAKQ